MKNRKPGPLLLLTASDRAGALGVAPCSLQVPVWQPAIVAAAAAAAGAEGGRGEADARPAKTLEGLH